MNRLHQIAAFLAAGLMIGPAVQAATSNILDGAGVDFRIDDDGEDGDGDRFDDDGSFVVGDSSTNNRMFATLWEFDISDHLTDITNAATVNGVVFKVTIVGRLDLDIPADLPLIVFGGELQNNAVTDPTLLVEPREAMGRAAAEALLECLDNRDDPYPSRRIPYHLSMGASTSRPPENTSPPPM